MTARIGTAIAFLFAVLLLAACSGTSSRSSGIPLDVTIEGHGSVTGPGIDCHTGGAGTCSGSYDEDKTFNFRATPDPGWRFAHWDGECVRTTPVCDVYTGSDSSLTAIFVRTGR